MLNKPYTIAELQKRIHPVAVRYGVERIAIFGSYARGEAKPDSDIDLHIDSGAICGYFQLAGFHRELEEALALPVDVLTTGSLDEKFLADITREEIVLYEISAMPSRKKAKLGGWEGRIRISNGFNAPLEDFKE